MTVSEKPSRGFVYLRQMSTVDIAEKQKNYLLVLHRSAEVLYKGVGESLRILYNCVTEKTAACNRVEPCWIRQSWCLPELQEMLEKVVILSDIMAGIQQLGGSTLRELLVQDPEVLGSTIKGVPEWTLRCTAWVAGVENFCNQMTGLVLPEAIKAAISHDPAVMDAFIALSQIRVAVDGALEQIVGINVQHSRLKDLESSYPEKVGEISQQQVLVFSMTLCVERGDRKKMCLCKCCGTGTVGSSGLVLPLNLVKNCYQLPFKVSP